MDNQTDTAASYKAEANEENSTQDGGGAAQGGQRPRGRLPVYPEINTALVISRDYGYKVIAKESLVHDAANRRSPSSIAGKRR